MSNYFADQSNTSPAPPEAEIPVYSYAPPPPEMWSAPVPPVPPVGPKSSPRAYSLRQLLSMVLVTAMAAAAFSSLGAYAVFSNLNQDVAVPAVIKPFTTPSAVPSEDTSLSSGNLAQVVSLTSPRPSCAPWGWSSPQW